MPGPRLIVVDACTRDGRGGSPTAVVIDDTTRTDDERRAVAATVGTSHTAFVDGNSAAPPRVRFFTSEGELRNCGHGTIAAQAVLLHRSGGTQRHGYQRTGNRTVAVTAARRPEGIAVWFEQGVIALRDHAEPGGSAIIAALGLTAGDIADDLRVASPGTPRLLVRVQERRTLSAMRPDFAGLAAECRRLGYLGCFAYALSPSTGPATARMFAPAIGVDEDIVNANSVGCLAAHLLDTSRTSQIEVHQGDALGRPSAVFATATHTRDGIVARIGGLVRHPQAPPSVPRTGVTPAQ
ncbi:PhzF family phenazine biosynthesis protein [Micromonospora lupini]|uniref:PhzF family phenazine biosynthesis protein n=1 Tax=Micromonospora lupini TaxID=285679 RepID=UPI002253D983|nr:PhzF family phenazine biosynthesis protein [Micromonospora lupini]MCX5066866.1 PhzF family phenazine biosynthesis protein [Micromonospora lupini]